MSTSAELPIRPGDVLELWARKRSSGGSTSPFALFDGNRVVYRIETLPPYFEHFVYTHYGDQNSLRLELDTGQIDASLFYRYNPATVRQHGITLLRLSGDQIETWSADRLPEWYAAETGRPTLHFSPLQGWMNDPNGLCRVGDEYHLFYQFHPNGTDWGPMHWGHAMSRDLYHWTHFPVFAHPQQNLAALGATGGAFSGSAFVDRDGGLSFYYTERLPAYDLFTDYKEIQRRMHPAPDWLRPVADRIVQTEGGPGVGHDVRDPKVWFDEEAGLYRMVLGAAVDGDPAILLHSSPDGYDWSFTSVLYRAPSRFRAGGARCAECPDFFSLDGHWVLIAGFVGYTEKATGRHNLLYAIVGDFAHGVFTAYSDQLQELDFGTDYYAMQSFCDEERRLAFAWLFNWEFRKPSGSLYSGELSLPRVLSLDVGRRLIMRPEPGYIQLRGAALAVDGGRIEIAEPKRAVEIEVSGGLTRLVLTGNCSSGEGFTIKFEGGALKVEVPEDAAGNIVYRSMSVALTDLRVFFDRGVLEIFANEGAVCGTRRTYRMSDLTQVDVLGDGCRVAAWQMDPVW